MLIMMFSLFSSAAGEDEGDTMGAGQLFFFFFRSQIIKNASLSHSHTPSLYLSSRFIYRVCSKPQVVFYGAMSLSSSSNETAP